MLCLTHDTDVCTRDMVDHPAGKEGRLGNPCQCKGPSQVIQGKRRGSGAVRRIGGQAARGNSCGAAGEQVIFGPESNGIRPVLDFFLLLLSLVATPSILAGLALGMCPSLGV